MIGDIQTSSTRKRDGLIPTPNWDCAASQILNAERAIKNLTPTRSWECAVIRAQEAERAVTACTASSECTVSSELESALAAVEACSELTQTQKTPVLVQCMSLDA